MKILLLDTYYSGFLNKFYKDNSLINSFSYAKHKEKIMSRLFGTADFYSKNLKLLGHQSEDIILNDKILQKKWAREHGLNRLLDWGDGIHIPFTKIGFHSNWLEEILEQQVLDYKPDVIYCQNLAIPGAKFLNKIKSKFPVFIVGQIASPAIFNKELYLPYDLILSSFPHFVTKFRKLGIKSEYFRIGFEPTILSALKKAKKQYPVSFVGGFSRYHNNETVFGAATDVWGYGRVPVSKKYHGESWGINMYNILYNSKITLNRHIETAENHANNMRLYEATGVGTMLITDYKKDLQKLFIPGKEVETYKTEVELAEKIKYYLVHDDEREKIAKAGQKRTFKDHIYKHRMEELVVIFNKYL
jgi:spore maturation protein CgeB